MSPVQIQFGKLKEKFSSVSKANAVLTYTEDGKLRKTTGNVRSASTAKTEEEAIRLAEESARNKVTLKLKEKLPAEIVSEIEVTFETVTEVISEPRFHEKVPGCTGLVFSESNTFTFEETTTASVLAVGKGGNGAAEENGGGGGGAGAVFLSNVVFEKDVWYTVSIDENGTCLKQVDQLNVCLASNGQDGFVFEGGRGGMGSFAWADAKGVTYTGGRGGHGVNETVLDAAHGESASPKPVISIPFVSSTITVGGGGGGAKGVFCGGAGFGKGGYAASTSSKLDSTSKSSFDTGFGSGGGGFGGKGGAGAVIIWFHEA